MMLYAFFLFAIVQTSFSTPVETTTTVPSADLPPILSGILKSLPIKAIQELKEKHLKSDENFQAAFVYLKSPEWEALIETMRQAPEWVNLKAYLKDSGLDPEFIINHIKHCINETNVEDFKAYDAQPTFKLFIDEVKETQGAEILKGFSEFGKENNEELKNLTDKIFNKDFKDVLDKAIKAPAVEAVLKKAEDLGLNIGLLIKFFYTINGWQ